MLKEVREDNKDNDAEHMKPVSSTWKPLWSMLTKDRDGNMFGSHEST